MKHLTIFLFCIGAIGFAQETETEGYNRWSLEFSSGISKPTDAFTTGYATSQKGKQINFRVNHFNLGTRYMFSPTFGVKMDVGYDQFTEGDNSLPFDTKQYRLGVQGVISLGQVIRLNELTSRWSVLLHGGVQLSQLNFQLPNEAINNEKSYGLMYGVTPMYKLSDRFALMANVTFTSQESQHLNWDGAAINNNASLSANMYHISLGVQWYLGGNQKHADWYDAPKVKELTDQNAQDRLAEIEKMLQDTDRDGVPGYLDAQNNTPTGVAVDTKGRYYDSNRNGVPDELEGRSFPGTEVKQNNSDSLKPFKDDVIKTLIEKGYVNIFYDVNQDTPNAGSTNNVYYIIQFLRQYPDAKAVLTGYSDSRGNEAVNLDLSQRRAQKLYNVLVASGLDANRISIVAAGVDASYDDNSTTGLNLARRVSISIQ